MSEKLEKSCPTCGQIIKYKLGRVFTGGIKRCPECESLIELKGNKVNVIDEWHCPIKKCDFSINNKFTKHKKWHFMNHCEQGDISEEKAIKLIENLKS